MIKESPAPRASKPTPIKQTSFKVKFFEQHDDGEIQFDFARFQKFAFGQMIILALLFSPYIVHQMTPHVAPHASASQVASAAALRWLLLAAWTGVFYVVAAFFEWVFHRYLFHIVPNFMARKHTLHHFVHPTTNYHSHQEEQTESAHFPAHALVAFMATFTLATWPLAHHFPGQPILLAVNIAVCLGYYRYELTHAHKHFSLDWQVEKLNDPKSGRRYEERFVLHFIHHDKTQFNMAVFAEDIKSLPDRVFGTHLPGRLERGEDGKVIVKTEDGIPYFTILLPAVLPRPIVPVRILDKLSMRWQAAFFEKFPTRRDQYHF